MDKEKLILIAEHAYKHGLNEEQIRSAWKSITKHAIAERGNGERDIIGIGISNDGIEIQLIARVKDYGIMIFHALTPPQDKIRKLITLNTEVYDD